MHANTLLALFSCLLAWSIPSAAAIIVVDTLDDEINADGDCSFREAIQSANSNSAIDQCSRGQAGSSDLVLALIPGEISISTSVDITEHVTIIGAGPDLLTLRLEDVPVERYLGVEMVNPAHDFELKAMRIAGGSGVGMGLHIGRVDKASLENVELIGHSGVPVYASAGSTPTMSLLRLADVRFEGNARTSLVAQGMAKLEIESCLFRGNRSEFYHGGAALISGVGVAHVKNSTFERNASADGLNAGALQVTNSLIAEPVELHVRNTSFANNRAGSESGDALAFYGPIDAWITNTTFSGNGRSIYSHGAGGVRLRIAYSTFEESGHRDYADDTPAINALVVANANDHVDIAGSVLFGRPTGGTLCAASGGAVFTSGGFNLHEAGDASCNPSPGDAPTMDPGLLAYEYYGGAVPVRLPRAGSDTFNHAGSTCFDAEGEPLGEDARGFAKPHLDGSYCDTGAVEWHPAIDDFVLVSSFDR